MDGNSSNFNNRPMTSGGGPPPNAENEAGQYFAGPRPASRKRSDESGITARTRPDSRTGFNMNTSSGEFVRPGSRAAAVATSRLQSARPITTSLRQGSAFRGTTGAGRPPTGMSTGATLPMHVMDRPVTQQGVTGVRSTKTSYGNRRMIHDKSYFLGLLHTKMGEITAEIQKLSGSIESLSKEQSTYITYEKRVQELAAELLEMQGEMADYNLLSDMIASGKTKSDIEEELKAITKDNKAQSQKIETIFNRRRETEKQISEYERGILEERNRTEQLIQTLNPELRERYENINFENSELQKELEILQKNLDELHSNKEDLYSRICTTEMRRRAAQLEEEFLELCEKRDELYHDADSLETPEEERQRLLEQIKNDNQEIATLERQIANAIEEERLAQDELKGLEHDIQENDTDRQQKYRELKKRENEMEEFIQNFDELKDKELANIQKLEKDIFGLLEKIAKNQNLIASLPETGISAESFSALKDDLESTAEEFDKAKLTTGVIEMRNEALKKQLENFETLEEKMHEELKQHETSMENMRAEMLKFQDTEKLKNEAADKNVRLQKEAQILDERLKKLNEVIKTTQNEYDKLKSELDNNEIHKQLTSLEKKWRLLEETNFELSSFLKEKKAETNYEQVKANALVLLNELNTSLQL